jgi:hypothetical protein
MANNSDGIAALIQPTLLQRTADYKLQEVLKAASCEMSEVVAASCADLAQYMGLITASHVEKIQALVTELVAGWAISESSLPIKACWHADRPNRNSTSHTTRMGGPRSNIRTRVQYQRASTFESA